MFTSEPYLSAGMDDIFSTLHSWVLMLFSQYFPQQYYELWKEVILKTVCLFVCLLAELHKYYWLHLAEKKNQKMGLDSTLIPSLTFESDVDYHLDTFKSPIFPDNDWDIINYFIGLYSLIFIFFPG